MSADQRTSRCPRCGEALRSGAARCPNGHAIGGAAAAPPDPGAPTAAADTLAELLAGDRPAGADLSECSVCQGLLEIQDAGGRMVQPSFCPWCGRPVSTIVGREVDNYRIESLLSKGGFSYVYLAANITQPKMKAVVKILRPELVYRRPELVPVFIEEARLTEEIGQTCWNVVRVFNVREKPWPHFFMEFIRGSTLDAALERCFPGKLPIEDAKGYLRGIAKGLAATHAHGRVHRDLKPLNIMIIESGDIARPEDRIKLLDFGLAMRVAGAAGGTRSSAGGSSLSSFLHDLDSPVHAAGTPDYMPPESFDGINESGGDIYSFGVTAYEIITGARPWKDPAAGSDRFFYWRDVHKRIEPRPIRELRPETPWWLVKTVMQCLEKDPRRRIAGAAALSESLREPVPLWGRAAMAAALALLAALVFYLFSRTEHLGARFAVEGGRQGREAAGGVFEVAVEGLEQLERTRVFMSGEKEVSLEGFELEVLRDGAPAEGVALSLEPDGKRLGIAFERRPELLSSEIAIRASSWRQEVAGVLRIVEDAALPSITRLRVVHAGQALDAGPGPRRFRPDAKLALEVETGESLPRTVELEVEGREGVAFRDFGFDAGRKAWVLPLDGVFSAGTHRVKVAAYSHAGIAARSESLELIIDSRVDAEFLAPLQPAYLARRRAYFRFEAREPLSGVRIRAAEASPWTDAEVHEAPPPSAEDPRGIGGAALDAEALSRWPELPAVFLVAAPVLDPGRPGRWEVMFLDAATPANASAPMALAWEGLAPPSGGDIVELALRCGGDDRTFAPRTPEGAAGFSLEKVDERWEIRLPAPLPEAVVAGIALGWRTPFRFLKAAARPSELPRPEIESRRVLLRDVRLAENAETRLTLDLDDAMERPLEIVLVLDCDTRKPSFAIAPVYADAAKRLVEDLEALEFAIAASEEVTGLKVVLRGAGSGDQDISPVQAPLQDADGSRAFRFKASKGLDLREGENVLLVSAADRAGNRAEEEIPLIANTGGPRIRCLAEAPAGTSLELDGRVLKLDIQDGNGVAAESAEVAAEYLREGASEPRTATLALASDPVEVRRGEYTVDLSPLPDRCKGKLTIAVRDALGARGQLGPLDFTRSHRRSYRPELVFPAGSKLRWVLVQRAGLTFFITKTEIANRELLHSRRFFAGGEKREHPRYWSESGEPPRHAREGGAAAPVRGDDFPLVGVSPQWAEDFARREFGGRLPTLLEWKLAARLDAPPASTPPYPWNGDAKAFANCYESWREPRSAYKDRRFDALLSTSKALASTGGRIACRAVDVDFDPFAAAGAELRRRLGFGGPYQGRLLHAIGNVGELVLLDGVYKSVGGDYESYYGESHIDAQPKDFKEESPRTGFRIVIDPAAEGVDAAFLKAAEAP
jgi:serine/threonine-protein kinase